MATTTITTRTPVTSADDVEDGVACWDWLDNNPDEDGARRFFKNGWEALMVNGRIIRGSKATKIEHLPGWWHISARCTNDPAMTKAKCVDFYLNMREGEGIVDQVRTLLRQWRDEGPIA
jgi:hypothetical protein